MDATTEQPNIEIVEKLTGSKDPQDFVAHTRVAKVAGSLDPEHALEWQRILWFADMYIISDTGNQFQIVCPTDPLAENLLVLRQNDKGTITFQEMHDSRAFYDNAKSNLKQDRGRFDLLGFPFGH